MKLKAFFIGLVAVMTASPPLLAFDITDAVTEKLEPALEVLRDENGITVNYSFPGAAMYEDDLYPGTYRFAIPGFGVNMASAEPALLLRWDTFEIPQGMEASVHILSMETSSFQLNLAPSREDLINSSNEVYSHENVLPVKNFKGWLPERPIEQGDVKTYRDRNILYVGVYPMSYNMEEESVKAIESLTYRIDFTPGIMSLSNFSESDNRHHVDDDYMSAIFTSVIPSDNSDDPIELLASASHINWKEGDGYLILSRQMYSSAVKKFADWKRIIGYNVEIVYADDWTSAKIKQTIADKYANNLSLKYLLLFGDELDIPGMLDTQYEYNFYTDYYYGCVESSIPELVCGRLSVSSLQEASTVVDKIIDYENLKHISGNVLHCAEFSDNSLDKNDRDDGYEDRAYTRISENIASGITSEGKIVTRVYYYNGNGTPLHWAKSPRGNGDLIPEFLRNKNFNWKGNSNDIKSAINDGILYVFHRDHGLIQSWSKPGFSNSDVISLSNGKMTPVVFSINCLTGMYKYYPYPGMYNAPNDLDGKGRSTCLAEAFIRKSNGGAVAVIAASQLSGTWCNDAMSMDMFQLMWPNSRFGYEAYCYTPSNLIGNAKPIRRLGDLLNATKQKVLQTYTGALRDYNIKIFHCFGDPSMELKTELPHSPNVVVTETSDSQVQLTKTYDISIPYKYKLIQVPNIAGSKVTWAQQIKYVLTNLDLRHNSYYIVGEDIAPTPLINYLARKTSVNEGGINNVSYGTDELKITYSLPNDTQEGGICVRDVYTGSTKYVNCSSEDTDVNIDVSLQSGKTYTVELYGNGTMVDSQKIMLK